jgi:hypothetical protein
MKAAMWVIYAFLQMFSLINEWKSSEEEREKKKNQHKKLINFKKPFSSFVLA